MLPTIRVSALVTLLSLATVAAPLTATSAAAASTLTPTAVTTNALVTAYAAARHVPAGAKR